MKLCLPLAVVLMQHVVTYFFRLFVGEVVKHLNSGVLASKFFKKCAVSYQSHWNVPCYRKAMDKADVHWSLPYSSNGVWNCLLHQLHCHLLPCFKSYTLCNHGELFYWRIKTPLQTQKNYIFLNLSTVVSHSFSQLEMYCGRGLRCFKCNSF